MQQNKLRKMQEVIELLHKGHTLDQIAGELKTSAKVLRDSLKEKYPLPGLDFSVGIEIEGFSLVGYSSLLNILQKEGIDISFREWQEDSLSGITNWTLTTDGSVTGFKSQLSKGMEIVSPPLYTMEKVEEFKIILNTIRNSSKMGGELNLFKVNKTCGVHIHFGINGRSTKFINKAYTLYRLFEPFLDGMLSSSREFNKNHCKNVNNLTFKKAMSVNTLKYWSIRVKEDRPTIEFRKHQGSTSYYKILYWILILQQILKHAEKIDKVSKLGDIANFSYFYKIIKNPLLIAYFNRRKKRFDKKKIEKLGAHYRENAVESVVNQLVFEDELPF